MRWALGSLPTQPNPFHDFVNFTSWLQIPQIFPKKWWFWLKRKISEKYPWNVGKQGRGVHFLGILCQSLEKFLQGKMPRGIIFSWGENLWLRVSKFRIFAGKILRKWQPGSLLHHEIPHVFIPYFPPFSLLPYFSRIFPCLTSFIPSLISKKKSTRDDSGSLQELLKSEVLGLASRWEFQVGIPGGNSRLTHMAHLLLLGSGILLLKIWEFNGAAKIPACFPVIPTAGNVGKSFWEIGGAPGCSRMFPPPEVFGISPKSRWKKQELEWNQRYWSRRSGCFEENELLSGFR